MKSRQNIPLAAGLLVVVSMFHITCGDKMPTDPTEVPTVSTAAVVDVTHTSAQCGGIVASNGGAAITDCGICWSTNPSPTLNDNTTSDSVGASSFVSSLTDLTVGTLYHVRAYASNSKGTGFGNTLSFTTAAATMTDFDGNVYQTVTIGTQVWMAENLKVTHYRNGDPIPYTPGPLVSTAGYCNFIDLDIVADIYGRLYNWPAVNDERDIAPDGWHVPSDEEWKQLETYLGVSQVDADAIGWRGTDEGGKMKEEGLAHWADPNTGATNESGFTALAGGHQDYEWNDIVAPPGFFKSFYSLYEGAWFWTSTANMADISEAWYRHLDSDHAGVYRGGDGLRRSGLSIRCVRD